MKFLIALLVTASLATVSEGKCRKRGRVSTTQTTCQTASYTTVQPVTYPTYQTVQPVTYSTPAPVYSPCANGRCPR